MNPNPEETLFALALAKLSEKRAAWLDGECDGDAALRKRLEALLAAHEQPETLLATQADSARPTIKLDLADAPDEAVGQTLGRYKLLERVGEGGCGMDTKQVVARFEAERQALATMDHPNIAKVLDAGTTDVDRPCCLTVSMRGVQFLSSGATVQFARMSLEATRD
ncbi:MAG: hypothetical protein EXS30_11475 [Pedosphaera sp.]|nr:hypothetical protein [Pedosphaera sp.]